MPFAMAIHEDIAGELEDLDTHRDVRLQGGCGSKMATYINEGRHPHLEIYPTLKKYFPIVEADL